MQLFPIVEYNSNTEAQHWRSSEGFWTPLNYYCASATRQPASHRIIERVDYHQWHIVFYRKIFITENTIDKRSSVLLYGKLTLHYCHPHLCLSFCRSLFSPYFQMYASLVLIWNMTVYKIITSPNCVCVEMMQSLLIFMSNIHFSIVLYCRITICRVARSLLFVDSLSLCFLNTVWWYNGINLPNCRE